MSSPDWLSYLYILKSFVEIRGFGKRGKLKALKASTAKNGEEK